MLDSESKCLDFADELDRVRTKKKRNTKVRRALRIIAKCHLKNQHIRTVDLMKMSEITSPATIHKIIQYLIDRETVAIQSDHRDGRIKYLIPTPRALKISHGSSSKDANVDCRYFSYVSYFRPIYILSGTPKTKVKD